VRLIERGSHQLRLTEEGHALHERTAGLMAELVEAGEAIASRAPIPRGRLRISAPVVFAHVALPDVATQFALAHPQVRLEVVAEDRLVDPVEEGYDIVIRVNPPNDERLIGRRILSDRRILVAAPAMSLPRYRRGATDEIAVPAIVSTSLSANALWRIRTRKHGIRVFKPEAILRLSTLLMVRDALLGGAGWALLPELLVRKNLNDGSLVEGGIEEAATVQIWALYSSRRLLSAKVRAFLDLCSHTFADQVRP
jgi:DNA-binding transcriptional LysR family regulator